MNYFSPNLSSFKISPPDRGEKDTPPNLTQFLGSEVLTRYSRPYFHFPPETHLDTNPGCKLSQGPDSSEQSCFPRALNTTPTVSRHLVQHVNLLALGHHIKSGNRAGSCPQRWPRKDHCQPPCLPTHSRPT